MRIGDSPKFERSNYDEKSVMMVAAFMGISSIAFAANPFSDVPQGHWAYASLAKLSGSGILEGYPDGTFKGSAP